MSITERQRKHLNGSMSAAKDVLLGDVINNLKGMANQSASAVAITGGNLSGISASGVFNGVLTGNLTDGLISNVVYSVTSASADLTLAGSHYIVLVSGNSTITLPTAVGITGRIYHVKNVGTQTIIVAASGSQVIDGDSSISIVSRYSSLQIVADGSNWNII